MNLAPDMITVSALNRQVASLLGTALGELWVEGEISSFTRAPSGHCYFTLKDEQASVRAVMFRSAMSRVDFRPAQGDKVEVLAQAGMYQPRGEFQLQVSLMRRAGAGDLNLAFLRLKQRLQAEGLFDQDSKLPIPTLPQAVAVVTSLKAAALQDVLITLKRRAPALNVYVFPTLVQGSTAARSIGAALEQVRQAGCVQAVLLVRGGGSLEDLWCYNDEALARCLRAFPLPVISGVGHETDFTIADFAADLRAPTPTAAAEIISAGHFALRERCAQLALLLDKSAVAYLNWQHMRVDRTQARLLSPLQRLRMVRSQHDQCVQNLQSRFRALLQDRRRALAQLQLKLEPQLYLQQTRQRLENLQRLLRSPAHQLSVSRQRLAHLQGQLSKTMMQMLRHKRAQVQALGEALDHLGPQQVLQRGYAILQDESGKLIRHSTELKTGMAVHLSLADGTAQARVEAVEHKP